MKRMIPLWIATLAGVTMVLSNFLPVTQQVGDEAGEVFNVLAAVAFVLGAGSLAKVHLSKLSARSPGWGYSVVTLLCFVVTLACGLLKVGSHPAALSADVAFSGKYEEEGTPFQWIYDYMLTPITSTLFALLAFYVASAAFRAFRAKNVEAMLLLGTAFIVLLGRTFAGVVLTGWLPDQLSGLRLENLSVYIMQVFSTAGTRAVMIGISLGVAATSLRILLGLDRSYLGSGS